MEEEVPFFIGVSVYAGHPVGVSGSLFSRGFAARDMDRPDAVQKSVPEVMLDIRMQDPRIASYECFRRRVRCVNGCDGES